MKTVEVILLIQIGKYFYKEFSCNLIHLVVVLCSVRFALFPSNVESQRLNKSLVLEFYFLKVLLSE